jgi:hypothetical protein
MVWPFEFAFEVKQGNQPFIPALYAAEHKKSHLGRNGFSYGITLY